MVCVVRQEVYQLVLALCMFVVSVQGVARTTISCGESGGVVGQSQVLSCNISGSIVNNIYWYRYNDTYNQNIVQCSKSSAENVSTCVAPPNLRSKYNVSIEDQPPRNPSFTIISVSAEDLEVCWLCVDSITFPDRASIPNSSKCSLKRGPRPDRNCGLEGGVAFICDFVAGVVVFLVTICVLYRDVGNPCKVVVMVIFAVASGVLGAGSSAACNNGVSVGGVVGINIGCMLAVFIVTIIIIRVASKCKYFFYFTVLITGYHVYGIFSLVKESEMTEGSNK